MSWRPAVRVALLACLSGSAACSIPLEATDSSSMNACDSSTECGAGATCAEVGGQRACVSTSAHLDGLILEVRPRASRALSAEVSHLLDLDVGSGFPPHDAAGQVRFLDLGIPAPARVNATVRLGGVYCGGFAGTQFPVRVEFRRVAPVLGLPAQSYSTASEPDVEPEAAMDQEPESAIGQKFQIAIPTGNYHIYLVPQPYLDCGDDVPPPILLPNQLIPEQWNLGINADEPAVLQGSLQVPQGVRVDGWKLDLVDPLTGSVISQVDVLAQGELQEPGTPAQVEFSVKFYWPDKEKSPLIRLRPRDGDPRPTVYWELASVALQGSTANLSLSLLQLDAAARRVEGRTVDNTRSNPVLSAVRIQSVNIDRAPTAAYKLDTETDANGLFRADLPPGEYVIFARPINDTTKATARQSLKFPAGDDCFCGQSVLIPEAGTLRGRVQGPLGELMDGATVLAVPSVGEVTPYLGQVLTPEPLPPRQASGVLRKGSFSLGVDPGEFDFSVRPRPGSTYPWLVRPRLAVSATDAAVTELDLAVPYPAVLQGGVRDASGAPLGDAAVVAWLPVESKTAQGPVRAVIQIGETRSMPDGSYVLPLPPSTSR
ncbi:carboxypeptidase regulatory-like domain-containing protein [Sorangium sp. So ce136]|uniref:carboxypeptidase-like regulatory domain-containing protein n=1 Tax=Sorangium sp. So ce136 TaxID=3133284 RepID=UPI003F07F1F2